VCSVGIPAGFPFLIFLEALAAAGCALPNIPNNFSFAFRVARQYTLARSPRQSAPKKRPYPASGHRNAILRALVLNCKGQFTIEAVRDFLDEAEK
jgi:hypothetical protein